MENVKEIIENVKKNGMLSLYEYVGNNYYRMDKEELKEIILNIIYNVKEEEIEKIKDNFIKDMEERCL